MINAPYTYYLYHKPTGFKYYGVRTANKKPAIYDLWIKYFSSCKVVYELIKVISPAMIEFDVLDIKNFCLCHNLNYSKFRRNYKRSSVINGWTIVIDKYQFCEI